MLEVKKYMFFHPNALENSAYLGHPAFGNTEWFWVLYSVKEGF